ncbi:MAG: glycosyl transferase, partial [Rhizobiaceae bacterium]|nr:glycosyl transferase [Rhizobiaceae bacterium]
MIFDLIRRTRLDGSPWNSAHPIREELFSVERLEQHAQTLAVEQRIAFAPRRVPPLASRLRDNAAVLLAAYRSSAATLEASQDIAPAAEWLLDNYHVVEQQIHEIRDDLPPSYYRQLPKLEVGPFAGYPRVFGIAWAFVAHTDSHFEPEMLRRFVAAYQRVEVLTIGELWAIAITLRIVLVENLRRLALQIVEAHADREAGDVFADRLLGAGGRTPESVAIVLGGFDMEPLSELTAGQLAKRLRDRDPEVTPAQGWLENHLQRREMSIETIVHSAQQRQGASNVSVRNVITSMRAISDTDWADWFESVSTVDVELRRDATFATMDFPTRNLYRSAIEELARGSALGEREIARRAVAAAVVVNGDAGSDDARVKDPGFYLVGRGRPSFERRIGFRPRLRTWPARISVRLGIGGYVGTCLGVALMILAAALSAVSRPDLGVWTNLVLATAGFIPALGAATALVNRAVTAMFGATTLPGLELGDGVPPEHRTIVVVPTLLTDEHEVIAQIERLEVHHLASTGGALGFALVSDWIDAPSETIEGDARLLKTATEGIDRLNRAYPQQDGCPIFFLLHRARRFNESEALWMGWERKRGKLHELNRLLRGAHDTSFLDVPSNLPSDVRYVVTLDSDTRLPRDAVRRLVGKMAHPLNRPRFDPVAGRVVDGNAILQPRVTPSLPVGREGSFYQRVYSSPGSIDVYAAAVSDVYQDLFGEGSFTGKGIYDIDVFEAAMKDRVPDNSLLSHDLFEGSFARAALVSDIEVVEEFPARHDVAAKRHHRWARGDWQLLPWIVGRMTGSGLPSIGRWKMIDNIRRTLASPLAFLAFVLGWALLTPMPAIVWTGLLMAATALPSFIPIAFAILPPRSGITASSHLRALLRDLGVAFSQTALNLAFVASEAWLMGDAIVRTLLRLVVTRRHLLEWTTAAASKTSPRLDAGGFYRTMAGGVALALLAGLTVLLAAPETLTVATPLLLAWLAAPAIALWISRSPSSSTMLRVSDDETRALRQIARQTFRFFETFVTADENHLPPDNFQDDPKPAIAHRTSPTNIGLYLLSMVAARDFGWIGLLQTIERLEATLATMGKLQRHRGHFLNWYETRDLRVLEPAYVSAVDSGNLAGHLIALTGACRNWAATPEAGPELFDGIADDLALVRAALAAMHDRDAPSRRSLAIVFDEIEAALTDRVGHPVAARLAVLKTLAARASAFLAAPEDGAFSADVAFWTAAIEMAVATHIRDGLHIADAPRSVRHRLEAIAKTAEDMALAMDFAFLLDPDRKLLSIGYSVGDGRLDRNCYDLLASEARLASLFAIAKGDVPVKHWFRLGRTATPMGKGAALISWSGSMFEYLMPSLVMRAPAGSLLEETNRLVVARQQEYGRTLGTPWGISESAFNARDLEFTYQYSNFGVPGLGLKRGLSEDAVIAPYASGLATMVDPRSALKNYGRMASLGARGPHGFYEALDFTPSRLPADGQAAIVRTVMAHHQGMTVVAIANTLQGGRMRERFHAHPLVQASELLLQERTPRDVAIAHPRAEEVKAAAPSLEPETPAARLLGLPTEMSPVTHLLSNGSYAVMLTSAGSGYSRCDDLAVSRWREDACRDDWGSFVFFREVGTDKVWSAGYQPTGAAPDRYDVTFSEDRAVFVRHDGTTITTTEVIVSAEDNAEVRRVSLTNVGAKACRVDLTSYLEVVLATAAADAAHPAFSKMFVETEYLADRGAIVATRRRRSPGEPSVFAAHLSVVEGEAIGEIEVETDRARFIGRGRGIRDAAAIFDDGPLSNTVGTVLDPVFSIRRRIEIKAGQTVRVAFWTMIAPTRDALIDLIDKHQDQTAFDRATTLAWTQAQVQLRHLDMKTDEAGDFQRLAAHVVYADPRLRPSSKAIARGTGPQSGLWPHGISGDIPIVLIRIDDVEDMAAITQVLRAHEYWRMKQLSVDLVILNERASSYVQDLQIAIQTALRSSQSRPRYGKALARGEVFALRSDLMTPEARDLLAAVARVVLVARRGGIAEHLDRRYELPYEAAQSPVRASAPTRLPQPADLEFFNGTGGFARDGKEYVVILDGNRTTPAPWINVIANAGFGFQVSATGAGYTWAENSRERQITPWSNDPVTDPSAEAFFVRDEDTGEIFGPTAQPVRDAGTYVVRHGFGHSTFQHTASGIAMTLWQFVPLGDPVKISRLTLTNTSGSTRRLSVTAYVEWVLGTQRGASAPTIVTEMDPSTGAMFASNPWNSGFGPRVAFLDLDGRQSAMTGDRREFLGRNGRLAAPSALQHSKPLSGRTGAGLDPCAAMQTTVTLAPGGSAEVAVFLGECASAEAASALVARYRAADLDAVFSEV